MCTTRKRRTRSLSIPSEGSSCNCSDIRTKKVVDEARETECRYFMTDIVDKQTRSNMMSGIRGKDTKPEMIVRSWLHRRGFRYRLHCRDLPGRPDLCLKKCNAVVFVHGCFWHQHLDCKLAATPKSRASFWRKKLSDNVTRDHIAIRKLEELGMRVLVVWECALKRKNTVPKSLTDVEAWLLSDSTFGEVRGDLREDCSAILQ